MARFLYFVLLLGAVLAQPEVCQTGDTRTYACFKAGDCAPNEKCGLLRHRPAANYGHCLVDRCYRLCREDDDCRGDKVHPNGDVRMAKCGEYFDRNITGYCVDKMPLSYDLPLPGHPVADPSKTIARATSGQKSCHNDWECPEGRVCDRDVAYNDKHPFDYKSGICNKRQKSLASRTGLPPFKLPQFHSRARKNTCVQDWQCPQNQVCNRDATYDKSHPFKLNKGICGNRQKSQASRVGLPPFQLLKQFRSKARKNDCIRDWECPEKQVCNRDLTYDKSQPFKLNGGVCGKRQKSQANHVRLPPLQLPPWLKPRSSKDSMPTDYCNWNSDCTRRNEFCYLKEHRCRPVPRICWNQLDCSLLDWCEVKFDKTYGSCRKESSSQASRIGLPLSKIRRSLDEGLSLFGLLRQPAAISQKRVSHQIDHADKPTFILPNWLATGSAPPKSCLHDLECSPGESCNRQDQKCRKVNPASKSQANSISPITSLLSNWLPRGEVFHRSAEPCRCSSDRDCNTETRCDIRPQTDGVWGDCRLSSIRGIVHFAQKNLANPMPSIEASNPPIGTVADRHIRDRCSSDADCRKSSKPRCDLNSKDGTGRGKCRLSLSSGINDVKLPNSMVSLSVVGESSLALDHRCMRHSDCGDGFCIPVRGITQCVKRSQRCQQVSDCPRSLLCYKESDAKSGVCRGWCESSSHCLEGWECVLNVTVVPSNPTYGVCVEPATPAKSIASQAASTASILPIQSSDSGVPAGLGSVPAQSAQFTPTPNTHKRSEALLDLSDFTSTALEAVTLPAFDMTTMGTFAVVGSSGVPAMHAALMPNGKVMFLDKVEYFTELRLADGRLAYSSLYDPATQGLDPLSVATNAFCCAGAFLADGRILTIGGSASDRYDSTIGDGFNAIRYLGNNQQAGWSEPGHKLSSNRWYASAQMLEDGSIFVASGSKTGVDQTNPAFNNPTYEILKRDGVSNGNSIDMDILVRNQPHFLYPFLHLLKDGNLFVFVARSSQLFHAQTNQVVKELPDLPGLFRTYGNTGGSVLLPLTSQNDYNPEIMICGGGAVQALGSPTDPTCGSIQPLAVNPQWALSTMPEGRCMVEGILLPDGTILWLNGAMSGAQGWGIASDPALEALIYNPADGSWNVAGVTSIARLYHSVALLLLDGTVLISGSNPNETPVFAAQIDAADPTRAFPTDFSVEIFTPPYLVGNNALRRPTNVKLSAQTLKPEGGSFNIAFDVVNGTGTDVKIVLYHGGFVTHSLHMGARMIVLDHEGFKTDQEVQLVTVKMPEARHGHKVVPPGPYVVYVVVDGIPAVGQFVMVQ